MPNAEQLYDLAIEVLPDGGAELEQGFMETNRITLHHCHVRLLLERTGHLLPPPPESEQVKRLARWLWDINTALMKQNASRHSPELERLCDRVNAYCESMPKSIVPETPISVAVERDPQEHDRPDFELAKQSAKGE